MHHIRGQHKWIASDGSTCRCEHDDDFQEREDLLVSGTPAFKAAQSIVLENRFLKSTILCNIQVCEINQ